MRNKRNFLRIVGCMFILSLSVTGCAGKSNTSAEANNETYETKSLSEFVYILEKYRNGVLANRNKERALESNYYAKRNFKSVDNPLSKVFCIEVKEIETYGSDDTKIYSAQ